MAIRLYDNGAVSHDRLYRSRAFRVGDAVRLGVTSSSFKLACSISEISTQYRHSPAPCECRVILACLGGLCDRTKTATPQRAQPHHIIFDLRFYFQEGPAQYGAYRQCSADLPSACCPVLGQCVHFISVWDARAHSATHRHRRLGRPN